MLQSLHVHNFALIEDAQVDFIPGFNVFTGETGAGKSILIDAFSVVLGNRASIDYIRSGATDFWVQAVFDITSNQKVKQLLLEQGIEEDGELFLKRRLLATGKGQATVNGVQVPLNILKIIGEVLVDIHGQHENQALLKPMSALLLVDMYGQAEIGVILQQYQKLYKEYLALQEKLLELEKTGADRERLLDRLEWEIKEIIEAELEADELERLQDEAKRLHNSEKIMQAANNAYTYLNREQGVLEALAFAKEQLSSIVRYDPRLQELSESLESCWITADECRSQLNDYLSHEEHDVERVAFVEGRLDIWYRLQKKYGDTYSQIINYLKQAQTETTELHNLETLINTTKKRIADLAVTLEETAGQLTVLRKKHALALASGVAKHIHDLAMPEGRFEISLQAQKNFSNNGKDELTFTFSANLGEPLKPLAKVASGGELSRIALAIKTVILNASGVPSMVFDEIDTGVGGVTAQKMAEKIALIAQVGQVLCITHLPQIAAFADRHILISKNSESGRTHTNLQVLSKSGRVEEMMRMTAGENISAAAQANAQELLASAEKFKQTR